ncbi:MAG TPA: poly-gamma-glutamate biosynthesis protein PgsC [Bacteroidales bacterium]|nr:poly-gamma-glutamate biosynthesis protein PgsC [Bacteroidales bacterium]HPE56471.1 poly-gamma-glutamate biosynthesis protein PgsC [Bacteroidales bacterium]HRX95549.1 poly-gamma-glutamate biosynthesis protein PgsC [Bacteroidales bacterium]
MVELAITLGLIFSLLSYEVFGLAAGGIVVPGYIALQLTHPDRLAGIVAVSLLTYLIIQVLGKYTFLYGRRQMVLSLLIGCLLANFSRHFLVFNLTHATLQLEAVGWVIPGLIAHWFGKQGIFKTIGVLFISAVMVRLFVILFFAGSLLPE